MKHRQANTSLAVRTLIFASCLALALGAGAFGSGHTQTRGERKAKVKTFTRMPLEVMEIRNLQNEGNWLRDLEIEVKNISRQPIYFISLTLDFPDVPMPTPTPHPETGYIPEVVMAFSVYYGELRLKNVEQLAGSDDIPLKPGETYVFKIPEAWVMGYESMNRTWNLPPEAWNRVELYFNIISLGDGTGYEGGRRMLYSKKKRVATLPSKRTAGTPVFQKAGWSKTAPTTPAPGGPSGTSMPLEAEGSPGCSRNGFNALAVFDRPEGGGNGDGVIDARDAVFSSLRLWRDSDHDGVCVPHELHTLPALRLSSVELAYRESGRRDRHGNRFRYRAKVTNARGAQLGRWAYDVFLVSGP